MNEPDVGSLSREELEAEVLCLRARDGSEGGTAFGRALRSTPAGRDALFAAVEKTRMPMILTDPSLPDDPIIFANRAFQELCGYGGDDLVGRNCRFLQGPDTDPAQVQRIRDALRDRRDIALDLLNYRRDGTPFLNELYISPVLGEDGRVLYHFGSQVDVTGYREDRRRVEGSEQRQRAVFDSIVDFAIVVTDRDGRVTEWNTGAERVLGWSADEMRGQTVERIFTPEDRDADRAGVEMRGALADGRASDERWHLRADGERFWASGEMMPLRDAAGGHIGFVKVLRDRTEQRLAGERLAESEARLRESEDHYRHTVELNPQVPWTCDPAGSIDSYSHRWLELTGQAPGEPDGAGWAKALHPDDLPHTMEHFAARLASGEPVDVDYRVRVAATGEYRWMRARAQPRRDGAGGIVRWYGVVEDVNDRKLAEERLRESEERYRQLFDAIDAGFCTFEMRFDEATGRAVDYRFLDVNAAFEAQTGLADAAGRWMRELAPAHEQVWFDRYGEVALTGVPQRFEDEAAALGRYYDISAFRVGRPEERQVGALFRDITARRLTELALRESEARFRTFAQAVPNHIWSATPDGRLDWANDRSYAFSGDAPGSAIADAWVERLHPDDRARVAARWAASLASGETYETEFRLRRADGAHRWFIARALPVRGPDGAVALWIGANTDIEDQKAAAEALAHLNATLEQQVAARTAELMRAEEALRQSQKMEAVGQLTGGIAHDFNNLLAGISGSLEVMGTRLSQGRLADVDKYMVAAQGAARRAAALTHRLLAFSRQQTLDPKPTDVNALVSGMTELIQRTVGPGIAVEAVGATGLWPALVDPSQLENALLNLCINARDAMPDGGRITVETANRWMDREAARSHDMPEGQYLSLCVTDTGTGMSPEVKAKAFEPFFTTKPIGQGTGLGLSMIYGFAKQSGGQVRIYSEVGQGTTVCLYLPRHYGAATDEATGPASVPAAFARTGETVLVVDDEPTVRMLVADVLGDLGYAAIEAADGPSGLKVLRSDARIDLLVTDVGLPGGMNGRQMADAAREGRPDLKVLFITGFAENSVVGNGHLDPGMHVLTKPFAVDALAARVRELISA